MPYATPYPSPFYTGAALSTEASSGLFDVGLGGRGFNIDYKIDRFRYVSVPLLKQQSDDSDSPGDQSINPEGLWRKYAESWHAGAGQADFDRRDSNPYRFRRSKGVYVFDKWGLTLLPDTVSVYGTEEQNLHLAVAGEYLYLADDDAIYLTDDLDTFTALEDATGGAVQSMASDGYHVWTAHGSNGIFRTVRGDAATASLITGSVELVAYAKGRVLAAADNTLYDVTAEAVDDSTSALPGALYEHPNTDFRWNSVTEAESFIYVGGFSGDKSQVYRVAIDEDGAGLLPPVVAAPLPDGEVVTSLQGYLGFVLIGTTKGVRFAVPSQAGDLTLGAVIETPHPVTCFEPQDRFVWFGWSNYDNTSTGLGRIDLSTFADTDGLIPAYASDLMVSAQGAVPAVVTFLGKRVFAVEGQGVFTESDELVPSGHVDSGAIGFGIADPKIGLYADVHTLGDGKFQAAVSVDGESFGNIGSTYAAGVERSIAVGEARAREFELRVTLFRDGTDSTLGPTLINWLFRGQPSPQVTHLWEIPLLLAPTVNDLTGNPQPMDTISNLNFIASLCASKEIVAFQFGEALTQSVVVDAFEVVGNRLMTSERGLNATAVVRLKEI